MVVVFALDELAEKDLPLDSNLAVDPDGEPIADLALARAEEDDEDMAGRPYPLQLALAAAERREWGRRRGSRTSKMKTKTEED